MLGLLDDIPLQRLLTTERSARGEFIVAALDGDPERADTMWLVRGYCVAR